MMARVLSTLSAVLLLAMISTDAKAQCSGGGGGMGGSNAGGVGFAGMERAGGGFGGFAGANRQAMANMQAMAMMQQMRLQNQQLQVQLVAMQRQMQQLQRQNQVLMAQLNQSPDQNGLTTQLAANPRDATQGQLGNTAILGQKMKLTSLRQADARLNPQGSQGKATRNNRTN